MLSFRSFGLFLVVFALFWSCGKPLPELPGVDQQAWKADKGACGGQRQAMMPAVTNNRDKLLALSEVDIVSLLGKPDEEELYKRNQKFYYYYVQAGPGCGQGADSSALRLVVRFNAVGLAKEVTVE
jgi:hypothetical protein